MKGQILVIGSLNMDLVVQLKAMPQQGETVLGSDLTHIPGGKGANQAFAAGRLGGQVSMLGSVGQDAFGDRLLDSLHHAGVNCADIQRSDLPTGIAIIYVGQSGDNSIVVVPEANNDSSIDYLRQHYQAIEAADIVLLQMEIPHQTVHHAIRHAKAQGKTVILNPAPAPAAFPQELFPLIDYLTPNETELQVLTGMEVSNLEQIAKAAQALVAKGVKKVLVTCGESGALLADQQQWQVYPAIRVEAVDTTAAGDTFNAAFAVGLLEGMSEGEAVTFANHASALVVTQKGAQSSIPDRVQVEAFRQLRQR